MGSESDHWICIYNQIIESGVSLSIIVSTENCNANAKYLRNAYHFFTFTRTFILLKRCIIMNQNIKCKTSHYSHFFIKVKSLFVNTTHEINEELLRNSIKYASWWSSSSIDPISTFFISLTNHTSSVYLCTRAFNNQCYGPIQLHIIYV